LSARAVSSDKVAVTKKDSGGESSLSAASLNPNVPEFVPSFGVSTVSPNAPAAAFTLLLNGGGGGTEQENWVEVSCSGAPPAAYYGVDPNANWTVLDVSGFETVFVNGQLIGGGGTGGRDGFKIA
jgi:hypothetical protein